MPVDMSLKHWKWQRAGWYVSLHWKMSKCRLICLFALKNWLRSGWYVSLHWKLANVPVDMSLKHLKMATCRLICLKTLKMAKYRLICLFTLKIGKMPDDMSLYIENWLSFWLLCLFTLKIGIVPVDMSLYIENWQNADGYVSLHWKLVTCHGSYVSLRWKWQHAG